MCWLDFLNRQSHLGKGSFERLPALACLYSVGHLGWTGSGRHCSGTALGQVVIQQAEQALGASRKWNFSVGFCFKSSGSLAFPIMACNL